MKIDDNLQDERVKIITDALSMTDKNFINKFERLLMLLGMGTAIILKKRITEEDKSWWLTAIHDVVYEDKPIPEMPEKNRCGKN